MFREMRRKKQILSNKNRPFFDLQKSIGFCKPKTLQFAPKFYVLENDLPVNIGLILMAARIIVCKKITEKYTFL